MKTLGSTSMQELAQLALSNPLVALVFKDLNNRECGPYHPKLSSHVIDSPLSRKITSSKVKYSIFAFN